MSSLSPLSEHPRWLHHGGRLREAVLQFGIPHERWLDLSSGINPGAWPVPQLSASAWARLPEEEDGLEAAAREYYATPHLLPVAGSQAAIQALPRLHRLSTVGVLDPAYAEHAHAWRSAGHRVVPVNAGTIEQNLSKLDGLVLIHPNNPTGVRFGRDRLLSWLECLALRSGWLIVDEAFMDATPEHSLCSDCPREGLIVLRSLGKFFGLAGSRVGFVCASPDFIERIHAFLGPWTISGPARLIATRALRDRGWQEAARRHLARQGLRLADLLARYGLRPDGGCALFQWLRTPDAAFLHEYLAHRAILTRLFEDPPGLRFGLPGNESEWNRLEHTLAGLDRHIGFEERA